MGFTLGVSRSNNRTDCGPSGEAESSGIITESSIK